MAFSDQRAHRSRIGYASRIAVVVLMTGFAAGAALAEEQADPPETRVSTESSALAARLQAYRDRLGAVGATLSALQQRISTMPTTAELEKELAELQARVTELKARVAQIPPPAPPPPDIAHGVTQEVALKDKKLIGVELIGKRVVPRQEPYFAIVERGMAHDPSGQQVPAAKVRRVEDGQAIDEALKNNGILAKLMENRDPRSQAFFFFVCSDAIDSFKLARRAVSAKGFAYAWDTFRDKDFIVRTDGGGPGGQIFFHDPNGAR